MNGQLATQRVVPLSRRGTKGLAGVTVFSLSLAVLAAMDGKYGTTYDEPIYESRAIKVGWWFSLVGSRTGYALSAEATATYWDAKDGHPGFYKMVAAACGATLGRVVAQGRRCRIATNLVCAAGLTALFLFVAGVWGRAAATCAVLGLLLMPRVFAHCHLGALDAPIMAMSLLTVLAAWRTCAGGETEPPRIAWFFAAATGIVWGLALGTKLNAFFVPFIVFPWVVLFARRHLGKLLLCMVVLGPVAFVVTWPWLWHDTWPRFVEYLQFHLKHYPVSVMYFGRFYDYAPWHYPLVMTAITVPPVTGALALVGLGVAIRRFRLCGQDASRRSESAALVLVVWALLVNLLPSCLPGTPKYGGVRLFLPIFPYVAILAAVGFRWGVDLILPRLEGRIRVAHCRPKLTALCLIVVLLDPLVAVARFTPYHLSYYNALIGGLPGATRRGMEPTYWGDTYRAASIWLALNAPQGATVWIEPRGFESTVRLCELGPLRPDLRFASGPEGLGAADYAVTQNKRIEMGEQARRLVATSAPVFTEEMDGVPLIYVFALR